MGFGSAPKVETAPPAVTYEDVQTEETTTSRNRNRQRLASAVNTRSSILTQGSPSSGKTLLGQ